MEGGPAGSLNDVHVDVVEGVGLLDSLTAGAVRAHPRVTFIEVLLCPGLILLTKLSCFRLLSLMVEAPTAEVALGHTLDLLGRGSQAIPEAGGRSWDSSIRSGAYLCRVVDLVAACSSALFVIHNHVSEIGLLAQHLVELALAPLVDLHLLDGLVHLAHRNLVLLAQRHVVLAQLRQVALVQLFIDEHQLFDVLREEVLQQVTLGRENAIPELYLVVTAVSEVDRRGIAGSASVRETDRGEV